MTKIYWYSIAIVWKTIISCRRRTRATRCLVRIVPYTEVDAQCDKLAKVVGRMSTDASIVNFIRSTSFSQTLRVASKTAEFAVQGLRNGLISARPSVCLSLRSTAAAACARAATATDAAYQLSLDSFRAEVGGSTDWLLSINLALTD